MAQRRQRREAGPQPTQQLKATEQRLAIVDSMFREQIGQNLVLQQSLRKVQVLLAAVVSTLSDQEYTVTAEQFAAFDDLFVENVNIVPDGSGNVTIQLVRGPDVVMADEPGEDEE